MPFGGPDPGADYKSYNSLVSARLDGMKDSWWRQDPTTAAWLGGSSLSPGHVAALSTHMPDVQQWVSQKTALAGIQGLLRPAVTKAMEIPDPGDRSHILTQLTRLQSLSEAQQNAVSFYIMQSRLYRDIPLLELNQPDQGPTPHTMPEGQPQYGPMSPEQETQIQRINQDFADGKISRQDAVAQINTLRFQTKSPFQHRSPGNILDIFGMAAGLAVAGEFAAGGGGALAAGTAVGGAARGAIVAKELMDGFPGLHEFFQGVSKGQPSQAVAGIAGTGLEAAFPTFTLASQASEAAVQSHNPAIQAAGSPLSWLDHELYQAADKIGNVFVPNASDTTKQLLGGFVGAVLLHHVTVGISGLTSQAGIPTPEAALVGQEALTAEGLAKTFDVNPADVKNPLAALRSVVSGQGVVGTVVHPFRTLTSPIVDSLARQFSEASGLADFLRHRSFMRLYDYIARLPANASDQALGNVSRRFPGLSIDLAQRLVGVPKEEMPLIAADFIENPSNIADLRSNLVETGAALQKATTDKVHVDAYNRAFADHVAAQQAVIDRLAEPVVPQLVLPITSRLPDFLHRAFFSPETAGEKIIRTILAPSRVVKIVLNKVFRTDFFNPDQQPWVSKLVDKIPSQAQFVNPDTADQFARENDLTRTAALAKITDQNRTYLNRLLQRFGVPQIEAADVTGLILRSKGQDFYNAVNYDLFGPRIVGAEGEVLSEGLLSKYLPKNTPQSVRDRILGTSRRGAYDYRSTIVNHDENGRAYISPVRSGGIRGGVETSKPFLPNDFVRGIPLPSEADIEDALSWAKRFAARHKSFNLAYSTGKTSLDATRLGLKPLVLLAAMPSIILKKTLDEGLGRILDPTQTTAIRAPGPTRALVPVSADIIGNTISGALDTEVETQAFAVPSLDVLKNKRAEPNVWPSLVDQLDHYRTDPVASQLARHGLTEKGVDAVYQLLHGRDEVLSRFRERDLADMTDAEVKDHLTRTVQAVRDATFGGHPDFVEYVGAGRLDTGSGLAWPTQSAATRDYQAMMGDANRIRYELSQIGPTRDTAARAAQTALQNELRNKLTRTWQITRKIEDNGGDVSILGKYRFVDKTHKQAISDNIKERFDSGEISLPDLSLVRKKVASSDPFYKPGMLENIRDAASKISELGYTGVAGRFGLDRIGRAETFFARGGYYQQRVVQIASDLRQRGMSPDDAMAFGKVQANNEQHDIFYDLAARSTAEKSVKNLFWFAPVTGELMYRWLYAIPARTGAWFPGFAATGVRLVNYVHILRAAGIVQDTYNPQTGKKELTVGLPGIASFINALTGAHLTENPKIPLISLFHLGDPVPSLSPVPSYLVTHELEKYVPAVRGLSTALAPFSDLTFAPSSVRYLAAIFGAKLPDFSPDYLQSQWDKTHDVALQYAWTWMQEHGDSQPLPEQFGLVSTVGKGYQGTPADEKKYGVAWRQWFGRLQSQASDMSSGLYMMKFLSAFAVPGRLEYSTQEERQYADFYQQHIAPKLVPGGPTSDALFQYQQNWEAQHPESLAFTVSRYSYTGERIPKSIVDDPQGYRFAYLAGLKKVTPAGDYAYILAALTSKAQFDGQLNAEVAHVAGDGPVSQQLSNLLLHWGERAAVVDQHAERYQNYLRLNPVMGDLVALHEDRIRQAYGEPRKSLESQYVSDSLQALKQVSSIFTGEGGTVTPRDLKTVLAQLKTARASLFQKLGTFTPTPLEAGINHYFDTVITPYMTKSAPIYNEISRLAQESADTSAEYAKLNALKRQYQGLRYQGVILPSPDAFFFGNKPEPEQKQALVHWATQPVSWLSDFQRQKLGYQSFSGEDKMWTQVAGVATEIKNFELTNGIASSSKAYDNLKALQLKKQTEVAQSYGPEAVKAFNLELSIPAVRISETRPEFASNSVWNNIVGGAVEAVRLFDAAQPGAKGATEAAVKQVLYKYIQQQELQPDGSLTAFGHLMQQLSLSTVIQGRNAMGVPLYEAIFFGHWVPQLINPLLLETQSTAPGII